MEAEFIGPDGLRRCTWTGVAPEFLNYHDREWGYPVADDHRLFEKISLEGFQAGLSWRTILAKRDNFRAAFAGFDFDRVAEFDASDVERLVQDAGIVRHRGKIEAVINNALRAQELSREFGSLSAYFWRWEAAHRDGGQAVAPEAKSLSKDLRKRGWKFVGPTTVHAFMQACGLLNDHAGECAIREKVAKARSEFVPPLK